MMFVAVALFFIFAFDQCFILRKAHGAFEDYFTFRGCVELLDRTDTSGTCKTSTGEILKIVKYQNKWYLDGDLPTCLFIFCL